MSERSNGGGADEATTVFLLEPNDVWFFRDGRPFDAQDAAQISMPSLFPPMPRTAIGAVRVALALALGWRGGGRDWSGDAKITRVVGSDDELGALEGARIFLVRLVGDDIKPLFPIPHALLGEPPERGKSKPRRLVRLRPQGAGGPLQSDLGQMSLTVPAAADAEACESIANKYWFDAAAMAEFLDGGTPDEEEVVPQEEIFSRETRTGIALKPGRKIVEEGMLYRVGFARPERHIAIAVALRPGETRADGIDLSGVPVPFGGEGRIAWIGSQQAILGWPAPPRTLANSPGGGELRYSVTLATPADLGDPWPKPGEPLPGLPGRIESACMDRAVAVSGWRGFGKDKKDKGPRQSHALIPAGATWFMTARPEDGNPLEWHGEAIGEQTKWGYGRIMIGTWGKE